MKINSIINRFIFTEMIPPFVLNLSFLTCIFLLVKILDIINLVVNFNVSVMSIIMMFIYSMPFLLEYTIPLSIMLTILLTFLRMSAENEIIALKSGGCSIYSLLPPVILFCLFGVFLTGVIAIYGVPWGQISFKKIVNRIATSTIDYGLKERVFNDNLKDIVIYINEIDIKKKELKDIFIEDQRSNKSVTTILAPRGKIISSKGERLFILKLFNGTYNMVNIEDRTVHSIIHFDSTILKINLDKPQFSSRLRTGSNDEMTFDDIRKFLNEYKKRNTKYYSVLMKYYEKYSIPFSCVVLGLLAFSLGLQSGTTRKSSGIGVGLVFFVIYFILLTVGWSMGASGDYPPIIAIWMPNILLGFIAIYFLYRVSRERPVELSFLLNKILNIKKFFRKK